MSAVTKLRPDPIVLWIEDKSLGPNLLGRLMAAARALRERDTQEVIFRIHGSDLKGAFHVRGNDIHIISEAP